ncbi:cell division protein SepF [[Acholeplasma] multilocale]|uniref:cell division protein SepF n=1 Tax=[Acholeplasma] multilocale TaxID=264638 RepID=UPI000408E373|nr:cell division protein SepF [[Acholeplasma] multilocale]
MSFKFKNIFGKTEDGNSVENYKSEFNQQLLESDEELQTFDEEFFDEAKTISQDVKKRTQLFAPVSYSAIQPVVDALLEDKVILLDFAKLSEEDKRRVKDFLSGVVYSMNGEFKKLENQVFKFIIRK